MTKFLLALIGCAVIVFLVANDTWQVILSTTNYKVSVSFVLFIVGLFVLWYLLSLLVKPFKWWGCFQNWRREKRQQDKDRFLPVLLTSLLSHDNAKQEEVLKKAKSLYRSDSQELLLMRALIQPQQEVFMELNQQSSTKLAGLYGLVQEAEKMGHFDEMAALLQQVPEREQKTPWVQQAQMNLALNRRDWTEALRLLDANKKYLAKDKFLSHKACLLLKLGQVKKAYHLLPTHIAIALAYAKLFPKKAEKVLAKTWQECPSWPVYVAYKEALKDLSEQKKLKAVLKLTRSTRDDRYSLLARADMDIELQNWARAKENLDNYLEKYPLTRQVASMMALVERTGWNHEQAAQEWENKATESEDDSLWICANCNHSVRDWQALCPHCNAFDTLCYK